VGGCLIRTPDEVLFTDNPIHTDDDEILIDPAQNVPDHTLDSVQEDNTQDAMHVDEEGRPVFTPAKDTPAAYRVEERKVPIPPHRMTPLKAHWPKIYPPLVEHLKLQVRMNVKNRAVELRNSRYNLRLTPERIL
jgi:RNA-binding protein PNO1